MDIQNIHKLFLKCFSVSTDTRKIEPRSFFIAIRGDRFDANTFAREALDKGASYVVIDNSEFYIDERTIVVKDSVETLQQLAKFHRNYLKLTIIALTGSNGKTTTKELIQTVLSKKYAVRATLGNLNNHIGVPLTLLSFTTKTQIGIVEMGANHQQEIAFLCDIAQPDFGYITNFGKAHLEGFGGVAGVIKGKSEMYDYLKANDKFVFVNSDDSIQVEKTSNINSFTFAINNEYVDINIQSVKANPFVEIHFEGTAMTSQLIGLYNANNIIAAVAISRYFNVAVVDIKAAIEGYIPENNRSQLVHKDSNEIILDAYNANPSSMAVAIENFIQLNKPNKIIVLGDMFELGAESLQEHHQIITMLLNNDQIECYFIGKDFYANRMERNHFHFYRFFEEFAQVLDKILFQNAMVLIKGSRGMALERTLNLI